MKVDGTIIVNNASSKRVKLFCQKQNVVILLGNEDNLLVKES